MTDLYRFFKAATRHNKVRILYSLSCIPAVIIHELAHIIMATLTTLWVHEVEVHDFYDVRGTTLYVPNITVWHKADTTRIGAVGGILISIAPLIVFFGTFVLTWMYPVIPMYILSVYFIFTYRRGLKLSRVDVAHIKMSWIKITTGKDIILGNAKVRMRTPKKNNSADDVDNHDDDVDVKYIGGLVVGVDGHQRPPVVRRIIMFMVIMLMSFMSFAQTYNFDTVICEEDTVCFKAAHMIVSSHEIIVSLADSAEYMIYNVLDVLDLRGGGICYVLDSLGTIIIYDGYIIHNVSLLNIEGELYLQRNKLMLTP